MRTADAHGLVECMKGHRSPVSFDDENGEPMYNLGDAASPLYISQFDAGTVVVATPAWHTEILQQRYSATQSAGVRAVIDLNADNGAPLNDIPSKMGARPDYLCEAQSAIDSIGFADFLMSQADSKLVAYISLPPPVGTPFCGLALADVSQVPGRLMLAKNAVRGCSAACPSLPFDPAVTQLSALLQEMEGSCGFAFMPLHNLIGGPILLARVRDQRAWTITLLGMSGLLRTCSPAS